MRLFISIVLPEEIKMHIAAIQKDLHKPALWQALFIPPAYLHITLVFLGKTPQSEVHEIIKKLGEVQQKPFTISLNKLEINSWHHPRVAWLTANSTELAEFVKKIELALDLRHADSTEFKGHITLARIKQLYNKQALRNLLANYSITPVSWIANSLSLVESATLPKGAVYTTLATFNLAKK